MTILKQLLIRVLEFINNYWDWIIHCSLLFLTYQIGALAGLDECIGAIQQIEGGVNDYSSNGCAGIK